MGACFDADFVKDPELEMTERKLNIEANKLYEQRAYEHGHGGYTGTLAEHTGQGVIKRTRVFETENDAYEYIQENHEDKWDTPVAYPVKGKGWVIGSWCSS